MNITRRHKFAAGSAVVLAAAGGGAAFAATQDSPSAESQAVITDAAGRLGVTPSALTTALQKALEDRIDAAVTAGTITKAEGDQLKSRIESGDFPLFAPGLHHGFGHVLGGLDAAASYLGLTEAQLRTQLESGKTLAQVAQAQGKSVDGLIQSLVNDATTKLDAAVAAGRITKDQEQSILTNLKQHITDLVNGTLPRVHDFGPPPGFDGDQS